MKELEALAVALGILALLAVSCAGWGHAACRLLRIEAPATTRMWIGWAALLLALEIAHFIAPINAWLVLPLLPAGVAFATATIRAPRPALCAALLVLAIWLLTKAMLPPANFDSGLYHFNALRWAESAPLVPGLANLHGRLGFNQSFFVWAAALDFAPLYGHGRGLANTFLLLLLAATAVARKDAAGIFVLPLLAYLAVDSSGLASPSPDLTSTILQTAMFLELARFDGESSSSALVVLAATAVTVKMSNAGFAAAIVAIALWLAPAKRAVSAAAVIALVWIAGNVVLSGAPLYPSALARLPLDWAVPRWKIVDEANWIASWARQPGADWHVVLGNWRWLRPWLAGVASSKIEAAYPLAAALLFALAAVAVPPRGRWRTAILAIPPLASLAFWFFTAPDIRFAQGSLLLLPVACALVLVTRVPRTAVALLVFAVANVHVGYYLYLHRGEIFRGSRSGWQPVPRAALSARTTASGLRVWVPANGQCWDSPLPCTPKLDPRLVPRRGGWGFRIDE